MADGCAALISLTAFGAAEVLRHGQAWFARLSREAGADGVEVRGELLRDTAAELPELAGLVAQTGMRCVYSNPNGLWDTQGQLDVATIREALARAATLGASVLKMPIGQFRPGDAQGWQALGNLLAASAVRLLVENDHGAASGTAPALQAFFQEADRAGVRVGMTFDVGNWHWAGEAPLEMARLFAERVQYIHCKGVQRRPDKWVAVPLEESVAPWRAILRALPAGAMRAIEYPLVGDDLLAVTRAALEGLRHA